MTDHSRVQPAVLLICLALCGLSLSATAAEPLLKTDFARDPQAQGWQLRACGNQPFDGGWVDAQQKSRKRCLIVRQGFWQSPAVAVKPFHYYRLRFSVKAEAAAHWAAVFLDAGGQELAADVYDSVYAAKDWTQQTVCFRAHASAAQVQLRFQAAEKPLLVGDALLEEVDAPTVAAWADEVAITCPPVKYEAPENRGQHLRRTLTTLERGGRLRIVMLGDSICNDTSNSLFETLLQRAYPKARIEVVASVRGGTGCPYFAKEGRVQEHVLRFQPDLVILAGISHAFDPEAFRNVIRQVRAGSQCEIMVLTGAICPADCVQQGYLKSGLPVSTALENVEKFTPRLRRMAAEEKAEFLDTCSLWEQYVRQSDKPGDWFHRDEIHANNRGKQVVGRILLRYFEPKPGG